MNLRRQLALGLGLGILTMGFAATQASAQEVYRGTFELPAAAYWGNTLLQPGQYTIHLRAVSNIVSHIRLEGEGMHADLLTADSRPDKQSDRGFLTIVDNGGVFYISKLDAGLLGRSFKFGAGKAVKERSLSARAGQSMTVPVAASGF